MKKIILTIVAILIVATGFAKPITKKNDISNCEITLVDNIFIDKDIKALWTLTYNNEEVPVTVIKHKTINGVEYVVHSKYFDVTYASTNEGFGTIEVRKSCVMVPKKITEAVINKNQWKNQNIITPNRVDDKTAINLISCYLPDLLNNDYKHLLS